MSQDVFTLYVAPNGNDHWSGLHAEPQDGDTDGPFATIAAARDRLRVLRDTQQFKGAAHVVVRAGYYQLAEPLIFEPHDSHTTYAAYSGEQPVISGGRTITNWQVAAVNGREMWVADLGEVAAGQWYFTQLWVNNERRQRPRLPKQGFHRFADVPRARFSDNILSDLFEGTDYFQVASSTIQAEWRNLLDVEIVAIHYWIEERLPIATFDAATNMVESSRRSMFMLRDDIAVRWANYYVENVYEALDTPGEWYLDRAAGKLYYLPLSGEDLNATVVVAPVISQWLRAEGDTESGHVVEELQFVGLDFVHAAVPPRHDPRPYIPHNEIPDPQGKEFAAAPQAACNVPGTIVFGNVRDCAIERCRIAHTGGYGVEIGAGCIGVRVVGCELTDLGAGGVRLNGTDAKGPRTLRTGENTITDNHIHAVGQIFPSAVGILAMHTYGNDLSHNHIHNLFYSGISCGWNWGYSEQVARDNRIAHNHIHDIGQGLLSDMGGIYTLGVQPGTVVRGNLIHDVEKANYGGWAIYCDEGSSHIVVENNVCFNTSSHGFHQHYGRENIVRNNIFAFCREGLVALSRHEAHNEFTLERNILLTNGKPAIVGGVERLEKGGVISNLNLFWDVSGAMPFHANTHHDAEAIWHLDRTLTQNEWHALGHDRQSVVADPRCAELTTFDFALAEDSPAHEIGFTPIDLSEVGPREEMLIH